MEMAEFHDERWPWCPYGDAPHQHSENLGEGPKVQGFPAGPMWRLLDRKMTPPTAP